MVKEWQRELPEAQGSVRVLTDTKHTLWRSTTFMLKGTSYYIAAVARWNDSCKNGSNGFYLNILLLSELTDRESDHFCVDDAPASVRNTIPAHIKDAQKWNGCHPFGPWYYIESTVYLAGDRDHHGLRKGETRQIRNGRTGELCWKRGYINEAGEPVEELPPQYVDAPTPPPIETLRVAYVPWNRVGDGKERQLDAARSVAVWPDATDEDLTAPGLEDRLKARLPALLVEFRKTIESLGLTW